MKTREDAPSAASKTSPVPKIIERLPARPRRQGPTCGATSRSGEPCGATPMRSTGLCFWHSPEVPREEKMAAALRGGYLSNRYMAVPDAPDPELSTPEQVTRFLREVAGMLLRGQIPPPVASALKGVADSSLKSFEMNLARRLAELEEVAAGRAKTVLGVRIEKGES